VSTEFLNEFASEQDGPVRVSDILARGVPIRWDEAVAVLQEILETITAGGGEDAPIPAFEDVLIDDQGAVRVNAARRGERGPVAAGRALHTLLATADVPLPLRLFVTQANAPETHKSLKAFTDALAYFGKPGRSDMIRALYERYRSIAPLAQASATSVRSTTPPPLPNPARGDEFSEARRGTPEWLMPAAVAVCVVSLAAVIWFGVFGGGGNAAASGVAPTNAAAATAEAPATAKDAAATPTNGKRPTSKSKIAERGATPSASARAQSTPRDRTPRADVLAQAPAPLFDPSAIRASEARPQIPDTPTRETTKATGPLVPATREYVVAPHEGATTTIYSAADADVQPPVMLYPSLPPTVFVARNADVTVINRMELVVSADGTVERVRLVNGPTRMPDMMLLSGAKLWKFSPATRNGEAVRYRAIVTWSGFP